MLQEIWSGSGPEPAHGLLVVQQDLTILQLIWSDPKFDQENLRVTCWTGENYLGLGSICT